MAFEVPTDLIRRVQIALRNDAGLSSYDPHDLTLPALPPLDAAIAEFDPSPLYLRCKHCKGRLLRGIQSVICVYCGKQQNKEVPPEPITFKSTFGYQWLLESLDLDASETIGQSIEGNELHRGQSTPKDEISLSDLLDLKITWSAESEKPETSVTNETLDQSKSSLNLTGVDLDNIFSGSKGDTFFNASQEQSVINKQNESRESKLVAGEDDLSLFQKVQPSETAVRSSEDKNDETSSGWEANFQSADSGIQHDGSKSLDPFLAPSVDFSAHMDSVFGSGKEELKDGKPKDDSASPPSVQDDIWNNLNSEVPRQIEQFDATVQTKDGPTLDNINNPSSTSIDWFQDDQWQMNNTSTPNNKVTNEDDNSFDESNDFTGLNSAQDPSKNDWKLSSNQIAAVNEQTSANNTTMNEDNDSFDEWIDFAGSTSVQDPSKNDWKPSSNQIAAVNEQTSEIHFFKPTNNFQEMDFGSFSQTDLFSGSSTNQNGSAEQKNILTEVSVSDRFADATNEVGENAREAVKNGDVFSTTTEPKDDVEMLISQMHDLSFMLENNLSVPPKIDGLNSLTQD